MKTNKRVRVGEMKIDGNGSDCPKCGVPMEHRVRLIPPTIPKSYYYGEWDYCTGCKHVQHYEKFKVWNQYEKDNIQSTTLF
jgi:hypothetical protein